ARVAERKARVLDEVAVVPAGDSRQLERGPPVIGNRLRVIVRPAERLDPLGDAPVLACALAPGHLPVGHVADEHVRKRVLLLTLDRRAPLWSEEALACER